MPTVEFTGQSARDSDNIAANPSRLINCYREVVIPGGRTQYALKSVLGLASVASLPGIFMRAMATIEGMLYAVCGARLYNVQANGTFTDLGAIPDSAETTIAGNNGLVTICADGRYFTWNGTTLTEPTPGAFSDFGSLDYFGNYTVLSERGGRRFQWSDIADATDLPGLNFSTADGKDDNILRVFAINGALYIFKETSHEVWYLTGGAGADAFQRATGGVYDIGLKAFGLICRFPGSAMFVGDDGRAHIVAGGGLQPVSTPAVETAIKTKRPVNCFAYEDEGHTFCVITFRDTAAWVYDIASGEWHERAEGAALDPWTVTATAKMDGEWYAGRDDGEVFRFARANADGAMPLVREATSRTLYVDGARTIIREFELFPRQGFSEGTMSLFVSKDGGATFGAEKPRAVGPVGNYGGRIIWRALGQARQWTMRIRWTDVDDVSVNAEARVVL